VQVSFLKFQIVSDMFLAVVHRHGIFSNLNLNACLLLLLLFETKNLQPQKKRKEKRKNILFFSGHTGLPGLGGYASPPLVSYGQLVLSDFSVYDVF